MDGVNNLNYTDWSKFLNYFFIGIYINLKNLTDSKLLNGSVYIKWLKMIVYTYTYYTTKTSY